MDLHPDSDPEVIVLSTSDAKSTPYPSVVSPEASRRARKAKPFIKSFGFSPSLRRESFKTSGIRKTRTRGYWEKKLGRQATEHTVNKYYSYHITGGFGGSGGEGLDQGGDGGTGQGPTVYFGQPQERELSKFRTIPLGDINLMKTIDLDPRSDVVGCRSRGVGVRRLYHAEIRRDPGTMTVAMYQGDGAEEKWRQHVAKHPNIMQLYGIVSTKGFHAMVFHDELIPYRQFLRRFEHSTILRTYIIGYCPIIETTEFDEATKYIHGVSSLIRSYKNSVWIRPSTGELCLDLAQGGPETESNLPQLSDSDTRIVPLENVTLDAPDSEDILISSFSDDQYHELCSWYPIARRHWFQISTEHAIGPGIFWPDSQNGTCVRITEPLQILLDKELNWDNYGNVQDELLPNSWIRITKAWLAQANCIFAELEETAHVEDYVCICTIEFTLRIVDKRDIPDGYLFVCPPKDFCTGSEPHANLYRWPACPAYWSLDPSGADRLSTEDAKNLGFPAIHIETRMLGSSWDCSVYEGLRRFHEGKGHDPESQEVARQLRYPLFEVSSNRVPFPVREGDDEPSASFGWNGMEATVPPVQMWNHQYAAASGSSVDLSLAIGLIAGGVAMVMRSAASLMARLVNAIFDVTLLLADLALAYAAFHKSCAESLSAREAMTEPLLLRGTAQSRRERTMDVVDEDADALGGGTPLIHDVADDLDDLERDGLAWSSSDTTPARSQIEEKSRIRLYERLATPSCSRSAKNAHSTANVGDKRREDGGTKARENKNTPAAADPTSTQYPPYSLPCSFSPCAALLLRLSSLLQDYAKSKGDQDRIQRIFRVYSPSIYGPWSVQRSAVAGEIDIVVLLAGF
ncbi:hypothetical protein MSAN_01497800 [Mycena sanguinolenta]|uniref:Uncharacterized protein n=1 Tax=Mycena sanguinolenta TaxID=230812 RepID=A0A8H6Y7N5_9AGAR|nr:hypothetical protein MSAN_01497800 [Mycena sanguinolenta]